jgi:hypothetical protein
MIVTTLLLAAVLGLQQDPRDRLESAVRESRLQEAEIALALLQAGDGARAARAILVNLPRHRERQAQLLLATVAARQAYDSIDTSFSFNLEEEKLKQKALRAGKDRIRTACAAAMDGEKIYAALLRTMSSLRPEAAPVLAGEYHRTANWLSRCEILESLGRMGAKADVVAALDGEKEPVVLAAGLSAVATEKGLAFLSHPHWQVRLAASQSLRESPGAVAPLIEGLGEMDFRLRNSAMSVLSSLTRTPLPPEPGVWQDWWKANGRDFVAGEYTPQSRKPGEGPGRTTFYGIPVASSRVCFVIDRSGSMRLQNRFQGACQELRRLLEELPDTARVNLIFFGGTSSAFSSQPTRVLDKPTRREVLAFVDRQTIEGGTDLYAALEKALGLVGSPDSGRLREDGPDTIIVLSDGQATVGRLVDDELVARVIARRARWLRPAIHTVALSSDAKSLQMLAELAGGQYTSK